jgi:hypothetical protein
METLEDFAQRVSNQAKCYFHKTQSGIISLKKFDNNDKRNMGCLGWISELKKRDLFRFETSKEKAVKAGVKDNFDAEKENMVYTEPGLVLYIGRGSFEEDFKSLITSIIAIMENILDRKN